MQRVASRADPVLGSAEPLRARRRQASTPERRHGIRREIAEGFGVVARDRLLLAIVGCTGTWAFFDTVVLGVLVLYATRQLGLGPGLLGLIFTAGSVGFLVGTLLIGKATRRFGPGPVVVGAAVVSSSGGIFIAAAQGPIVVVVPILAAGQFIIGLGSGVYFITTASLRQMLVLDRLQGRVNASMSFLSDGIRPLGAVMSGVLGANIGLRPTLVVGAIGGVVGFLWVWFSPLRAPHEPPTPEDIHATSPEP